MVWATVVVTDVAVDVSDGVVVDVTIGVIRIVLVAPLVIVVMTLGARLAVETSTEAETRMVVATVVGTVTVIVAIEGLEEEDIVEVVVDEDELGERVSITVRTDGDGVGGEEGVRVVMLMLVRVDGAIEAALREWLDVGNEVDVLVVLVWMAGLG